MRHLRNAALAALLPVLLATPAAEQTGSAPQVTFSTQVNYVEITAVVTDEQGNLARNLTLGDFQLFEGGKPQPITVFSPVDLPAPAPVVTTDADVERDVSSNRREFTGRVYVILLDDLHTLPLRTGRVRAAARRFIDQHLGPDDLAAIVTTSGRPEAGQELTGNRRLLAAAIDRFQGRKPPSSTIERLAEYRGLKEEAARTERNTRDMEVHDPTDAARAFDARSTLRTLRGLIDWMSAISGRRKSILLISEGLDYDVQDIFNLRSASDVVSDTRDTVGAATRANVSIFAVDPRGLTLLGEEGLDVRGVPDEAHLALGPASLQREVRITQDSLRVLADETGGFAVVNANDLSAGLQRIVAENSSYYLLGYNSRNTKPDGKFRSIEVRVRRPGLRVRARRGFVVPKTPGSKTRVSETTDISTELRRTLDSPLPISGLPLTVSAAAFFDPLDVARRASVAVTIEVDAGSLRFTQSDGVFRDTLEVALMLVDPSGTVRTGDRHSVDLKLKPDTLAKVQQGGIRLVSRVLAAPGQYQLKVAARETGGGRIGSVLYDLEVPEFDQAAVTLSGIVVTSTRANLSLTVKPDPPLEELLPAPPTNERTFTADETIAAGLELYDALASRGTAAVTGAQPVELVATVARADGRVMFRAREEAASDAWRGQRYRYQILVPMRDLAPAAYTLTIEARAAGGSARRIGLRRVPFAVAAAVPRS